jgi:DNA-binding XRE family transcriptional regulator
LTQANLAEQLAITRITIQNLENAKNPTLDTVLKVAVHFDELGTIHDLIKNDID